MSIIEFASRGKCMSRSVLRSSTSSLLGIPALLWFCMTVAHAADPIGTWQTKDGRARIRTVHCNASGADLCGYVVWLRDPRDRSGRPRLDAANREDAKKTRPLLGHELMAGLRSVSEGRYEGDIYNADDGKVYRSEVWSGSPGELSIKGCVAVVLCVTQTWRRVTDVLPGQLRGAADSPAGPRSDG